MTPEAEAAVRYAERGWAVFPLHPIVGGRCGCRKSECADAGKHPIEGAWQRSIPSVAAARAAWRPALGARGIGLLCGPVSRVFGVDADRRHGAEATLRALKARGQRFQTVTDVTGDGWHFLYRWPEDFEVEIRSQDLGGGLQCRGAGHFLVMAPSRHQSGRRYGWLSSPFEHEIAPAPDWLLELIAERSKKQARIVPAEGEQPIVPIGQRWHALIAFLGLLRSCGLGDAALVAFVDLFLDHCVEIDEQRCPLDRERARAAARDIARRYPPNQNRKGNS